MLVDIETFFLDAAWHAEAVDLVEHLKDYEAHACCPCADDYCTEELCEEEVGAATVEPSFFCGEETCEDGAEATADTVY